MEIDDALKALAQNRSDEEAWTRVYDRFWPYAKSIAFRLLHGSNELAEEAAQEAFIRIFKYCPFDGIQTSTRFRAFLGVIAKNVAIEHLKKLKARYEQEQPINWEESLVEYRHSPEAKTELEDYIGKLLAGFGKQDQSIVSYVLQGYDLKDIAEKTGLTESNVGVRLYRLRRKIRERHELARLHEFPTEG